MDGWGKHDLPPTSLSLSLFLDFAQRAIHSSMGSHAIFLLREQSICQRVLTQFF